VFCIWVRGVFLWRSPRQVRSQGARVRPPGSGGRPRPGRRGAGGGPGPGGRGCLARRGPAPVTSARRGALARGSGQSQCACALHRTHMSHMTMSHMACFGT
jgi:hypothetical protein